MLQLLEEQAFSAGGCQGTVLYPVAGSGHFNELGFQARVVPLETPGHPFRLPESERAPARGNPQHGHGVNSVAVFGLPPGFIAASSGGPTAYDGG